MLGLCGTRTEPYGCAVPPIQYHRKRDGATLDAGMHSTVHEELPPLVALREDREGELETRSLVKLPFGPSGDASKSGKRRSRPITEVFVQASCSRVCGRITELVIYSQTAQRRTRSYTRVDIRLS